MAILLGDTAQTYWQRVALMKSLDQAQRILPYAWYEMLEEYYLNNGLYDLVSQKLHANAIWTPGMKPLRNPAHRAVEFHVSKLWAGPLKRALPIVTQNDRLLKPIAQIWQWSNWAAAKQVAARWFANFGDLFIKVAEKAEGNQVTRIYLDPLKPKYVTEFDLDERGFLTFIRIDVPAGDENHTEVWSKTRGGYRMWKHNRSSDTPLDQLGTPLDVKTFDEMGFDFIPIVHAKFQDIGEPRGVGVFVHALDKIDEANRQATRLHEMLFRYNKPTKAVSANAMDSDGRPLPPPTLTGHDGSDTATGNSLIVGDDDLYLLPGASKLSEMVPQLQYDDALSILNAQMEEIARDLPEVLYYELKDRELSGVAIQRLLEPAIDRVIEARGSGEAALVRANQMALTIAGLHGLEGFDDLGSYEDGDLEHSFAERDVIPLSTVEKAQAINTEVTSGVPLITAMKRHGYAKEEIDEMIETREYRLQLLKLMMEITKLGVEAEMPVETILRGMGWTKEQLESMGTQRLAAIKLRQEDVVPGVKQ